jgi:hypothetical protein
MLQILTSLNAKIGKTFENTARMTKAWKEILSITPINFLQASQSSQVVTQKQQSLVCLLINMLNIYFHKYHPIYTTQHIF